MAIDTRSKLNSMISFGDIWHPAIPIPDGPFDQGDLQHLLHGYSGVLWTAAIAQGDTIIGLPCIAITAHPISLSFTPHQISISAEGKPIIIEITGASSCQ